MPSQKTGFSSFDYCLFPPPNPLITNKIAAITTTATMMPHHFPASKIVLIASQLVSKVSAKTESAKSENFFITTNFVGAI